METKNLQVAKTEYSRGEPRAFEIEINLDAPGFSEWIIIPEQVVTIAVTVSFTSGGTGKVQATTDKVYEIKTGTPEGVDWPFGIVDDTFQAACIPPSAIRAEQVGSGSMIMTVRAQ